MQQELKMGTLEWLLLIALSILWGGAFFFAEIALREVMPLGIVFARVSLAALALLLVVRVMGHHLPKNLAGWRPYFAMGLLNNLIPFCLIVWGQSHIASGLASILNATTPLFTVLLAHYLTQDERMTPNKLVGVLIGFGGVVIMLGTDLLSGFATASLAQIAILGAAISYAFAGLYGRRFKGHEPIVTATGQVTASSIMLVPLVVLSGGLTDLANASLQVWSTLIVLALACTSLAYLIYFRILRTAGATNLMLVTFLIPPSAIVLGVVILDEVLEPRQMIGMALIAVGLALIDGRLGRKLYSPA